MSAIGDLPGGRWEAARRVAAGPDAAAGTMSTARGGYLQDLSAFDHELFDSRPGRRPPWTPAGGCCRSAPGGRWGTCTWPGGAARRGVRAGVARRPSGSETGLRHLG